jgi:hypothetical protein
MSDQKSGGVLTAIASEEGDLGRHLRFGAG